MLSRTDGGGFRLRHVVLVGALLAALLALAPSADSPASADVANPGTLQATGLHISGNLAGVDFLIDGGAPPQCSNGVNDDDDFFNEAPQDQSIDYPADPECASPTDVSEIAPGDQPFVDNSLLGTIDAAGDIDVPQASASVAPFWLYLSGIVGEFTFDVTGDVAGTLHNDSNGGAFTFTLPLRLNVDIEAVNWHCDIPFSITFSDDAAAAENSGQPPVTPVPYDSFTGLTTATNNTFTMPGSTVDTSFPGADQEDCDTINGVLGLPGLSGASVIEATGAILDGTGAPFRPAPVTTTKTADAPTTMVGGANGYTVTFTNPQGTDAVLDTIIDDLPAGFTYVGGSTTGATTSDPTIVGQQLTWSGPFVVPAESTLVMHFGVAVSPTPGTYFNDAGGSADGWTIVPSGPTAPITVTPPPTTTTTTTTTTTAPPPAPPPSPSPPASAGPAPAAPSSAAPAPLSRSAASPAPAPTPRATASGPPRPAGSSLPTGSPRLGAAGS